MSGRQVLVWPPVVSARTWVSEVLRPALSEAEVSTGFIGEFGSNNYTYCIHVIHLLNPNLQHHIGASGSCDKHRVFCAQYANMKVDCPHPGVDKRGASVV